MKNYLKNNKRKINPMRVMRMYIYLLFVVVVGVGIFYFIYSARDFLNTNRIVIQSPVVVQERTPEVIKSVEYTSLMPVEALEEKEETVEEYIMRKFGKDGKTAIALAYAESGFNCEALGANTEVSKTYRFDVGLFQINSVHWTQDNNIHYLTNCKNNVDVAYNVYSKAGNSFSPWSAYNNGSYLKFL